MHEPDIYLKKLILTNPVEPTGTVEVAIRELQTTAKTKHGSQHQNLMVALYKHKQQKNEIRE